MNMMLAGTEKSFPLSLPPHFPTIGSIWLLCLRLTTKLCMLSTVVKTIHYTNMCMPSTNLYCQPTGEPMPLVFLLCTLPPVDIVQFFQLMQGYQWTLFSSMCFFSLISDNSNNRWFITQLLIVNLTNKNTQVLWFDVLQTSSSKTGQWLTAETLLKTFLNIVVIADKG